MKRENIDSWPYPAMPDSWKAGNNEWHEVSQRIYDDQLCDLPPAKMGNGCFAVGEPYSYSLGGSVHAVFVEHQNRFFGRMVRIKDWNPSQWKIEIQKQFFVDKS